MFTGISPIEEYVGERLGLTGHLTPETLFASQLLHLKQSLRYAMARSAFYGRHLAGVDPETINTLSDIEKLPMTSQEDIRAHGEEMLCMPQSGIEKIVTLQTSGSEGRPKRLFFTADDLRNTEEFFGRGMRHVTGRGGSVMVFLPGDTDMSVGTLIEKALVKTGLAPTVFGPICDMEAAAAALRKSGAQCLIGLPAQILQLARTDPSLRPESVMLCADYVPDSVASALKEIWGCRVFCHYGSTEMGLGGGVECRAHDGYHMRDADMLFEIIDPCTGRGVPDGRYGEVVFTTLARRGMPLIRYRTGDIAAIIPGPCGCGGVLRRISAVRGRLSSAVRIGSAELSIHALDEILFALPEVLDYTARVYSGEAGRQLRLEVKYRGEPEPDKVKKAVCAGYPGIGVSVAGGDGFFTTGVLKRTIFIEN